MIENQLVELEPYFRTVTTILIHSLWQGVLLGAFTALVLSVLRSSSVRIRYIVSCSAMVVVVLAVAATAVSVWPGGNEPASQVSAVAGNVIDGTGGSEAGATAGIPASGKDVSSSKVRRQDSSINRYIFIIWVVGVVLFSIYHLLGWCRARGFVKRGASPAPSEWQARFEKLCRELEIRQLVSLLSSALVKVPCVIGWIKPVVLVPASMFTSLHPSEIEMILVHELAHIRRYDVLVNILQTAMETLFFFNPAIWWLSRRIRIEREDCCDDTAIIKTGDRIGYARALANLEELRMLQTEFGAALNSTPFKRRVERIVGIARPPFFSSMQSLSGLLLVVTLAGVILGSFGGSKYSDAQARMVAEQDMDYHPEPGDLRGEWEVESSGNELKILVYGRKSSGMNFALDRDEVEHLIGQGRTSFEIVRDAGTTYLVGTLKERGWEVEGNGEWYFRPDTTYMKFMRQYGLREDDRQKTFSLAIRDISREYLAGMEERGYHDLKIDQLISAGIFGISPELVDEYRELGYPDLTYQQLLSLQVQAVNPYDAPRFGRLGMGRLTPEQLVSARIQGLTPGYVESFRKAGFNDLTFKNFTTLHAFGLDVGDFEDCYRNRFMDLSEENMVWVCGFGITLGDVERMKERGHTDIDTIIRLLAEEYGR
ncbi:MAG: M56 family metallopeptidase [Candidatus Zixiibacteriota bacterium]|nr:MAG: M56 family metallopeptidase [candidate division Zixibacteria bacterium]